MVRKPHRYQPSLFSLDPDDWLVEPEIITQGDPHALQDDRARTHPEPAELSQPALPAAHAAADPEPTRPGTEGQPPGLAEDAQRSGSPERSAADRERGPGA